MVRVYVSRLDREISAEEYELLYKFVSEHRQKKIDRLKHKEDKLRSLLVGSLFRFALGEVMCGEKERMSRVEASLQVDSFGKPSLEGVEFNLSHAGKYVAVAIGEKPLGVDVEGGRKHAARVVSKFHEEEKQWYRMETQKDGAENADKAFYRLWTAKESVMKRDGRGIAMAFDSFSVLAEPLKNEIHTIWLDKDYCLSLCTEEMWNQEIKWIFLDTLIDIAK